MTVQLTNAGNYLALLLKESPTGEKQRAICKFCLTLSMKKFQQLSLESTLPSAFTLGLTLLMMTSFSSDVYNSATSPDDNKSLI